MSYDVSVADEWHNYTYNLSALFHDCIDGGLHSLHGLTGAKAAAVLGLALDRLATARLRAPSEQAFREQYDAPNGWGSTLGAVLFLGCVMASCQRHPRSRVRVT